MSEPYYCENFIDIFSVCNNKLAIYPQYIVFGKPIFDISSQKVKFNCQTSLKIPEDSLNNWLSSLYKVLFDIIEDKAVLGQHNIYSEEPIKEENKEQLEKQRNCFFYEIKNAENTPDLKVVIISSTYLTNPVHFTFDSLQFLQFCQAFSTGFFKMYCYTPTQNLCIQNFIETENSGYIIECSLYEAFLHLRAQTLLPLSLNECIRTSELIIRHKEILIKWKQLALLL